MANPKPDNNMMEHLEARKLLSGDGASLDFEAFYPEGFANDNISEYVPITNPNDFAIDYELYAQYAKGERDQLIQRGTIPANTRRGVVINEAGRPETLRVRPNDPYSLVLRSTAPVGATLSHYDFGTAIGETFTQQTSTEWSFGEGKRGGATRNFVVLYNPSDQDATVTLTVFTETGQTQSMTRVIGANRRGGWNLAASGSLPQGEFGIRIVSDVPIVSAISAYETDTNQGFGALGQTDGGALAGVINGMKIRSDGAGGSDDDFANDGSGDDSHNGNDDSHNGNDDSHNGNDDSHNGNDDSHNGNDDSHNGNDDSHNGNDDSHNGGSGDDSNNSNGGSGHISDAFVKVLNTNATDATVTFTFIPKASNIDPATLPPPQIMTIASNSRSQFSLVELSAPVNEKFTIAYRSDVPVTVTASRFEAADAVGVEAAPIAATQWTYGEGFMSQNRAGNSVTEDIYMFNPTTQNFSVTIEFFFNNSTKITITESMQSLRLKDIEVHDLLEIRDFSTQSFYGIRITSPVPIVSTMEHWDRDQGGGFSTLGMPGGTIVDLIDVLAV